MHRNEMNLSNAGSDRSAPTAHVSWLTAELALSGHVRPEAMSWVARQEGVRRVVDLRSEACDDPGAWREHGVELLHLPTPDLCCMQTAELRRGVDWVLDGIRKGERVLVHCQHGIGRSALLACCALVALGHSPLEALRIAKRARPIVSPTPDQLHALLNFAQAWYRECGSECPPTTWDELAGLAYNRTPIDPAEPSAPTEPA